MDYITLIDYSCNVVKYNYQLVPRDGIIEARNKSFKIARTKGGKNKGIDKTNRETQTKKFKQKPNTKIEIINVLSDVLIGIVYLIGYLVLSMFSNPWKKVCVKISKNKYLCNYFVHFFIQNIFFLN